MDFLQEMTAYLPDIMMRMNKTGNEAAIRQIEEFIGEELPTPFKTLYAQFDGEKNEPYTGLFLGFYFMDARHILETIKEFQNNDSSEITSLTTGKVSDEKMCERIMIPFAWDSSRGYFCLDMSPDTQGKKGQVVALDYDFDECILISDSLDEFYDFVLQMLKDGKCYTTSEEAEAEYFTFETGHFFNAMKDILKKDSEAGEEIALPELFWQKHYNTDKISVSTLKEENKLWIMKDNTTVSLTPVIYMSKLRELIIHCCTITDFECICGATELKKLILVDCTFDYEKLEVLSKLSKLKEITLRKMPITDISKLAEIKSLKNLRLLDLKQLDTSQLTLFTKLQGLELEGIETDTLDFLKAYKALKELELKRVTVANLDFLQHLKKLTRFRLSQNAKEENGLQYLKELPQLKEFNYPVSDMTIYTGCDRLEEIGIDAVSFQNPQVLKDSNIKGVMVYNARNEEEAENIIHAVQQHVKLYHYGTVTY